jgi:DNA-binding PadR family transcriptional regulator
MGHRDERNQMREALRAQTRQRWEGSDEFGNQKFGGAGGFGPGFGGPGFGRGRRMRGGGPGRRARRGDVRAAALALLVERPMHGYEMIQELEERTGGVWRPSPGAVYPALQLLEDQGLVTAETADGKRRFQLTEAGREEAAKLPARKPWEEATEGVDPGWAQLKKTIGPIVMAMHQVAEVGTPAQKTAAVELLAQLPRSLYALLAEPTPEPTTDEAVADAEPTAG